MTDLPKGYTCKCGEEHLHPAYVFAHWSERLKHTCSCGRVNSILRGKVTIGELPSAPKN